MRFKDRFKLILLIAIERKLAENQKDFGKLLGYTNESYLSQIINEKISLPKDFINKLKNIMPDINEDWLLNENGNMMLSSDTMIQNNHGGNNQQGHQNHQIIASEKSFIEYIASLKQQNELTKISMEHTAVALHEISEQRKQMDRLITMIENLQSKQ